jgi:hypothetical protein
VSFKLKKGYSIPDSYKIGVGVTILCALVKTVVLPHGWGISTGNFLLFGACYFGLARISKSEIRNLIDVFLSRGLTAKPKAVA